MRRGRPKDSSKAKNRVISLVLSEPAYNIYRKISSVRGRQNWIHEYVSEKLKKEFAEEFQVAMLKDEIGKLQGKEMDIRHEIERLVLEKKKIENEKQQNCPLT